MSGRRRPDVGAIEGASLRCADRNKGESVIPGLPVVAHAVVASLLVAHAPVAHHNAHHTRGCRTHTCDVRVGREWTRKHPPPVRWGPLQSHVATYYSVPPCDHQTETTASGQHVRFGIIASNYLPLHTKLRLTRPIMGRVDFEVLDTGAEFDVWLPCPVPIPWGNPEVHFRVQE